MTKPPLSHLRLSELPSSRPTDFALTPTGEERQAIAEALGIVGVKKLRFAGSLSPQGKSDWHLSATLGATVVQTCVVTLDPVTTRIDEPVDRRYLAEVPEVTSAEVEMPEDDTIEALPETLDLSAVMAEALSLALPTYPRKSDAALGTATFTEPGIEAMTDDDAKPFAALGALRETLAEKGDEDES